MKKIVALFAAALVATVALSTVPACSTASTGGEGEGEGEGQ